MNPLSFQFKENPKSSELDFTTIEYSNSLNLSIAKKTGLPAIECLNMETETMTKAQLDATDSDDSMNFFSMDTMTGSFDDNIETSDSDQDKYMLQSIMDTETLTERIENTDQDPTYS